MPRGREELRRGVRHLIEVASREMEALSTERSATEPRPEETTADRDDRPILRLVREPLVRPRPVPEPEAVLAPATESAPPTPAPEAPQPVPATGVPKVAPVYGIPPDASGVHPRKGVCAAYYVNHSCWEIEEAYCNQALHVCMLRDCPVYNLNREELERRFAAKFAHLW